MHTQERAQQTPHLTAPIAPQALQGSIIDAQGREIPITEAMIQTACRELDRCSLSAGKRA